MLGGGMIGYAKAAIAAAGLAALVSGAWYMHASIKQSGRDEARAECAALAKAALDDQRLREKELQAKADTASTELETARGAFEKSMKERQNELRKTTANLRACRVNFDTVRLLNESTQAARRAAGHPRDPGQRSQPLQLPRASTDAD